MTIRDGQLLTGSTDRSTVGVTDKLGVEGAWKGVNFRRCWSFRHDDVGWRCRDVAVSSKKR